MSVEAVDECLDTGLVEVSEIRCRLTWFLSEHERLRVYEAKGINDDFAFHALNRIYDDGDSAWCKLFEGLLGVDVDG